MDEGRYDQITKLLRETVIMLCRNGVCFERQLKVQGLIGVTVDSGTVFLVHVNETCNGDGCSSSDKTVNYQHSVEASTSSQSFVDRVNEPHQAEEYQWPKMSEASSSQYSRVRQEREPHGSDQYAHSQNAADVTAATIAAFLPVQECVRRVDDDVICIESVSSLASVDNSHVKHEPSGIWNTRSISSAAGQQEYGMSDYSERQLSNTAGSRAPVHADTSQYSESLGIETGYGDVGMTHYSTSAPKCPKLLQNMPKQLARRGRGYHKMVIVLYYIPVVNISISNFYILHNI